MYCLLDFIVFLFWFLALYLSVDFQFFAFDQNILVVSKYYSRITLKRLADLLCLSLQVIKSVSENSNSTNTVFIIVA